jgi:hypothetical protein
VQVGVVGISLADGIVNKQAAPFVGLIRNLCAVLCARNEASRLFVTERWSDDG